MRAPVTTPRPAVRPRVAHVLVVDDDPRVLGALGALISASSGLELAGVAGTMDEALAAATEGAPGVVVVDVMLPTLDEGLAVIRAASARCPVLALSVSAAGRPEALAAGASAFLEKDSAPNVLLAAVRGVAAMRE